MSGRNEHKLPIQAVRSIVHTYTLRMKLSDTTYNQYSTPRLIVYDAPAGLPGEWFRKQALYSAA